MVLQIREKKLSIQPFEESQIPTKDECIQKALDSLVFVREVLEQALKTQESSKPSLNSSSKKDCLHISELMESISRLSKADISLLLKKIDKYL